MKIVFATSNTGKLQEASSILGSNYQIITLAEAGITEDIPETGSTLRENALIKAKYIAEHCHCDCFADDTGLEVEILGGAPGVFSARYAGEEHDNKANIKKLLQNMAIKHTEASMARKFGVDAVLRNRRACFKTVICLFKDGRFHFFEGRMEGEIGFFQKGENGFGYDSVFIPDMIANESGEPKENKKRLTLAELSEQEKNMISHRGRALRMMLSFLKAGKDKI